MTRTERHGATRAAIVLTLSPPLSGFSGTPFAEIAIAASGRPTKSAS